MLPYGAPLTRTLKVYRPLQYTANYPIHSSKNASGLDKEAFRTIKPRGGELPSKGHDGSISKPSCASVTISASPNAQRKRSRAMWIVGDRRVHLEVTSFRKNLSTPRCSRQGIMKAGLATSREATPSSPSCHQS